MSHYHTDDATSEDALNYEDFRQALDEIIRTAETPLTVGIFGAWGSGKSSLMRMLQNKLDYLGPNYRTVWFTAWKYDQYDALWRTFISRVLDALYPRQNGTGPRETRPILEAKPGTKEADLIQKLDLLQQTLYRPILETKQGERDIAVYSFLKNAGEAKADMLLRLLSGGLLSTQDMGGKGVRDAAKDAAKDISKQVHTHYRQQLFYMEQFEQTLADVVKEELGQEGRLIIFVDDLDRCLPEKAIAILEAIKLFLEVKGVIFVLGMDQAVIRKGIEAHYGASFGWDKEGENKRELPIRGDSYLQKLVQIPFHLPALGIEDVQGYIKSLDNNLSEQTQKVIAQGIYPNPRQVKRILNIHRLLRTIAKNRKENITDPLLAKTVILQTQYPELYQLWRQYPTLVETLEREYASRPSTDDERLTGRAQPLDEEADVTTASNPQTRKRGGLLADYIDNRTQYSLLERLMTYPPADQAGEGNDRARFTGLSREQMAAYVRLAGAVETADPTPVEVDVPILEELLSHEAVKIQDAVSRVQAKADEAYSQAIQQQLVQRLQNKAQSTPQRLSAGEALALLGDPRFYGEEGFHLPQDEQLGFIPIPAGKFRMGSEESDPEARDNEKPAHDVHLADYSMAKYPVTVAQFKLFVSQTGHEPANKESLQGVANHPVRYVSWIDAMRYAQWLTQTLKTWENSPADLKKQLQQGWQITLPTEKQWEKAARGAGTNRYPWGDTFMADNANHKGTGLGNPSPVGCFPAGESPYDLLDMSGNVWEWTRTIYHAEVEKAKETTDINQREGIVLRGGSFYDSPEALRCAYRHDWSPPHLDNLIAGFRVCVSISP